jgi:alpha-beta hydrolase superfamily lysophospholipase
VRRLLRWLVVGILAIGLVTGVAWLLARPDQPDAFYASHAAAGAPGTLLAVEDYERDIPTGAKAWRILFATTRIDDSPAVASAVVMAPMGATGPLHAVTWAHGTNGTVRGCAPSIVGPLRNVPAVDELLDQGWAFIAPDYVGLGTEGANAYLVGEDAARTVLDAVRAARQMGEIDILPQTVVWGHSQGGNSALWAGMLGVAAQAPASDLPNLVKGTQEGLFGKIVSSFLLRAYAETYPDVRIGDYVSGYRAWLVEDIARRCAVDARALFSVAELALMPGPLIDRDLAPTALGARLQQNVPAGPFDMPVFIAQGENDEIVLEPVQAGYARQLCGAGADLVYERYPGLSHLTLVAPASPLTPDLIAWSRDRFEGVPAQPVCRS